MSLNQVTIQGNMAKDCEIKTLTTGNTVTNFAIAVQRNYKNREGKYDVDFIECMSFEKTPFISKYFHKGDSILVTGELMTNVYTDTEGKKRKVYAVNVSKAHFCGKTGGNGNQQASAPVQPTQTVEPYESGELPFEQ